MLLNSLRLEVVVFSEFKKREDGRMQAVLLALKKDRILGKDRPQALVELCGVALIERNLRSLKSAGVTDIVVVTGHKGDMIGRRLGDGRRFGVKISYVNDSGHEGHGDFLSVLEAASFVEGDFILLWADGVFDSRIAGELAKQKGITYCYDSDPSDKRGAGVLVENGQVRAVRPGLEGAAGALVGMIVADPRIFPTLEECAGHAQDWFDTLDAVVRRHRVCALDIARIHSYVPGMRRQVKPFWFHVETKEDLLRCKKMLVESTQKGTLDLHAWYINRPIENKIVYHIADFKITPNQLTVLTNLVAWVATFLFLKGFLLAGSAVTFLVSVMDGLDGKLARAKGITTKLGHIEHSFDLLFEQSWYIGLAWYLYSSTGNPLPLKICIGILFSDAFVRHCYMQFKEVMGVSLSDYAPFDRLFRKIGGRKNIYIYYILVGVLFKVPLYSLIGIMAHSIFTAIIYAWRACKHMKEADSR